MRRYPLSAALLASALAVGCGPKGEEPRASTEGSNPLSTAPFAAAAVAPAPLGPAAAGYDNAQQVRFLQAEAKRMGISALDKPSGEIAEPARDVTYDEGLERTRAMTRQFAAQRRALDRGKPKPVDLPGTTPDLIPGKPEGGPLQDIPKDPAAP